MVKKKRKQHIDEQRELTRKEVRIRARDRERNRKLFLGVGIALGLALLFIIVGAIMEFAVQPNSVVATVGENKIITKEYRRRVLLQQNQLLEQLTQLRLFEQQFGGGGFFAQQISQIESTLTSPLTLGGQVLNQMIDEKVILQEAAKRGIMVSDDEVNETLREEIATRFGYVTEPQATETVEANANATVTATASTPTATQTIDISSPITATVTPLPTAIPLPILSDTDYDERLEERFDQLQDVAGLSIEQYREIIRAQLLSEKLAEVIGEEQVSGTEEQVNARHILLRPRDPTPTPTELPEDAPMPTLTDGPRTREETLTEIQELRRRIVEDGEDFTEIAAEYSDDASNAASGGDLGWFGPGRMVPEFEEAAFSLEIREVSEPISTTFGYHLIEVLEKDSERPKEESALEQERRQAYQNWLTNSVDGLEIDRPTDIESLLPTSIRRAANRSQGQVQLPAGGHGGWVRPDPGTTLPTQESTD